MPKGTRIPISLPLIDGAQVTSLPPTRLTDTADGGQVNAPFPWGWVPRDPASVSASWRRQAAILRILGEQVRIQACLAADDGFGAVEADQRAGGLEAPWSLAEDLLVIGSVPGPCPALPGESESRIESLREALRTSDVDTLPARLVDRDHAWTEPALVTFGRASAPGTAADRPEQVLVIARLFGFDHVVRVRAGQWQVLRLTAPRVHVESRDPCSVTRDVGHRCPMLRAPAAGEYCRMIGGPYTSASIHAAAGWQDRRDDLVSALGCDTCEGIRHQFEGRIVTGGGPIAIGEKPIATRWLAADGTRLRVGEGRDG